MDTPLTKYEKCKIISTRATQIANGAKILVKHDDLHDPIDIALREFYAGIIPISIKRALPNGEQYRVDIVPNPNSPYLLP